MKLCKNLTESIRREQRKTTHRQKLDKFSVLLVRSFSNRRYVVEFGWQCYRFTFAIRSQLASVDKQRFSGRFFSLSLSIHRK